MPGSTMYSNIDIIFETVSQSYATHHAPCDVLCVLPYATHHAPFDVICVLPMLMDC